MLIRQPALWIAAAALAVAVVCASPLLRDGMDEEAKPAAAPDLFPFVQALPHDVRDNGRLPGAEERADTNVEMRAAPAAPAEAVAAENAFRAEEMVRRMRAHGASDDEVYRARAAAMNAEKAAALAHLDREEDAWHRRVAAYQVQRNALDALALQEMRNRLFTAEEQERLAAYEQSGSLLPGLP